MKWGIISTGHIAAVFSGALSTIENGEKFAVASRDINKANAFAKEHGFKKAYGSYEEMLKDPEVEVVYIGTPHVFHHENTLLAQKYGKPVLCEKVVAMNTEELNEMINGAREKNIFFMEGMWTKCNPNMLEVKKRVDRGDIGKIKFFKADLGLDLNEHFDTRVFRKELGGGALLDLGIYVLTMMHWFLGLPDKVEVMSQFGKSDVDEITTINAICGDTMIDLSCSISTNTNKTLLIQGEKGRIVVPKFWSSNHFFMDHERIVTMEHGNHLRFEAIHVMECIKEGKVESNLVPWKDSLEVMELLQNLLKKIEYF